MLSEDDVRERLVRNRLTLAYDGDMPVGNATIRPPQPDAMTATVIVRASCRSVAGRAWIGVPLTVQLAEARGLRARRIETVVLAANEDGLAFAVRRGFVEFDRYVLDGDSAEYIDLYLPG